MLPKITQVNKEASMASIPFKEGSIYFCVDKKKLYYDPIGGTNHMLVSGGGGGSDTSASTVTLTSSLISRTFSIMDTAAECILPYTWTSVDSENVATGSATAEWYVNGIRVSISKVPQGDNTFDVRRYLTSGIENSVILKITDVFDNSKSINFNVTISSYSLTWNLDSAAKVYEGDLFIQLVANGDGDKTLKVAVNDKVVSESVISTSGRNTNVTIPAQEQGSYTISAWIEVVVEGETLSIEPLTHMAVWVSNNTVVGILNEDETVGQYTTVKVLWLVVDPASETCTANLLINGEVISTLENVSRTVQTWNYKADNLGEVTLAVECNGVTDEYKITVESLGYDIQPVTGGLTMDFNPAGHSNSEANRDKFGYLDGSGTNHPVVFSSNFDWTNGGFQEDENDVTAFVVRRGCRVTFDTSLFVDDAKSTGRNIKLMFKSANVRNYDAQLMTCKSGNIGLVVNAQRATVTSNYETISVPYCEDRLIEMDIVIEPTSANNFAYICLKGIPGCPPIKYGTSDSWVQTSPAKFVIGSDDADVWIYRVKAYNANLNRFEIMDNYIADCVYPSEMVARYERNNIYDTSGKINITKLGRANPALRTIHIKAKKMTESKNDKVSCDIEINYVNGGEAHHQMINGAVMKAQGTSSLEYILAALNLDIDLSEAYSWVNGNGENITEYAMNANSIPVDYFNLKANVASSESANNIVLADDYNNYNPYICAPKAEDDRVRDTVEGNPCVVFFTNTSDDAIDVGARVVAANETIMYFAGDMNNSKKNYAVFGQDNTKYPKQCCVEIMNNTEAPCRFRSSEFESETWKDGNFEFRFPDEPTDEMKQKFIEVQTWVTSTTRDLATNTELDQPVMYNNKRYTMDTAEYRAAKFLAEFENYFVKDAMLFHYLFTERHCMVDNRAKNVFMCYEYVEALDDYRWSVRCDYDNDTAEGNDNTGGDKFGYGIEDTDRVNDSYAFNAYDSTLWCNIRDLMFDDLTNLYINMAEAWSSFRIIKKFNDYQGITPEAVRVEDMWNKYFIPWINKGVDTYSRKCFGDKEYWREQFEVYQEVFMDSKYLDATRNIGERAITLRPNIDEPSAGNIAITPYCKMYLNIKFGNGGMARVLGERNVETLLECPTDNLGNTETYIYGANRITHLSSLGKLKTDLLTVNTAPRLQQLIVGSDEVGYQNPNLQTVSISNNPMLELLDLRGLPNLKTSMDLSQMNSLEYFYAVGSGITDVTFPTGGILKEITLPSVRGLTAINLLDLELFSMNGKNLNSITVVNCPLINTLQLCKDATNVESGRITNVDWVDENPDVLLKLAACNEENENFILTGVCSVNYAMQSEIDLINERFPGLALSVNNIVPGFTVKFANEDGTVYNNATHIVRQGGNAINPVWYASDHEGEKMPTNMILPPTKESSVELVYTFGGWNKSLENITADTTFTATYTSRDRYYTVRFWSSDEGGYILQQDSVIAHGYTTYNGSDLVPESESSIWMGWNIPTTDIVSDMDIYPVFVSPILPTVIATEYDYLYSDDPDDNSAYTLEQFYGIIYNNRTKEYFQVGDKIKIVLATDVITDTEIIMRVIGFNHYKLADGSGDFAGCVFNMVGVLNNAYYINSAGGTNDGGYAKSAMRTYLNDVIFPELPQQWKAMLKNVIVKSSKGYTSPTTITESENKLFLLSKAEIKLDTASPFVDEIDPDAESIMFDYFTDDASANKYMYNGTGSAARYWTRSPGNTTSSNVSIETSWQVVYESRYIIVTNVNNNFYISFAFCV